MLKHTCLFLIALALVLPLHESVAAESKELRKQRQEAQKERQERKKERTTAISEATKVFREFAQNLKTEYQEKAQELDVDLELKRVELEADAKAKITVAEADYQNKVMSLFINPGSQSDEDAISKMQADGKEYADGLFALRKESAEMIHREKMGNEKRKNELMSERDQRALEEAASLGLTKEYAPILAAPIGDSLTKQEEQWNDRERKEVVKIKERNQYTIGEFEYGARLRGWELQNMEEDFELEWREKAEDHALGAEQSFYNLLLMQSAQGGEVAQQDFMSRITELNKEKELIKIKYKKIKDQNRIKRREERKKIQNR
jgi:hypothetical protein